MNSMLGADQKMRSIKVNMTKKEVISVMGKVYEAIAGSENMEVIGYKSNDSGIYKLYFENGILKEWNKEWLVQPHVVHDCHHDHATSK